MPTSLEKLLAASARRQRLLADAIAEAANTQQRSFCTEDFLLGEYGSAVEETLTQLEQFFMATCRDSDGNQLIDNGDISIEMLQGDWGIDAGIEHVGKGAKIEISAGIVLAVDFLCASMPLTEADILGDEAGHESPLTFRSLASEFLCQFLSDGFAGGIPEQRERRILQHFMKQHSDMRLWWNDIVTAALIWLACHEYGHWLCGHVAHFSAGAAPLRMLESMPAASQEHGGESVELMNLCAESMADQYATLRVIAVMAPLLGEDRYRFGVMVSGCAIMPLLSSLQKWDRATRRHPRPISRIFGVLAATVFAVSPTPHAGFDQREFPFAALRLDKMLGGGSPEHAAIVLWPVMRDAMGLLSEWDIGMTYAGDVDAMAAFVGSAVGARIGLVAYSESVRGPLQADLLEWAWVSKELWTSANVYFGSKLKEDWIVQSGTLLSGLGGAADPVYRALDTWGSQVCHMWSYVADSVVEQMNGLWARGRLWIGSLDP